LAGYDVALFMYGQTGAGKTHTMVGPPDLFPVSQLGMPTTSRFTLSAAELEKIGVVPRACKHVLDFVAKQEGMRDKQFKVDYEITATYIEIYKEKLTDLVAGGAPLVVRQDGMGFFVDDAVRVKIASFQDVVDLLRVGESSKQYLSTQINDRSSRGHTIFTLQLVQKNRDTSMAQSLPSPPLPPPPPLAFALHSAFFSLLLLLLLLLLLWSAIHPDSWFSFIYSLIASLIASQTWSSAPPLRWWTWRAARSFARPTRRTTTASLRLP